jgi:microcystin-dependent protein
MPKVLDSSSLVGEIKALTKATAPDGYLICNGSTIGSASSGATKTGQMYYDLFVFLWTNYSNSQLQMLNSSNAPVNRGASALADWSSPNNYKMPLPNLVGRTLIGSGTYTDAVAGSVTRTLGDVGGNATQTLAIAELPAHSHGGGSHTHSGSTGAGEGSHNHPYNGSAVWDYNANTGDNGSGVPRYQTSALTASGGAHTHTVSVGGPSTTVVLSEGGGGAHNNMQPYHTTNWIIRY